MTLLTPEQIEAVKETTKVISQNPAWREAIVTVMKTPNLPTITKAASSVNMSVSSFIRHFNVACWKAEEIIKPMLQEAKRYTIDEIDDLVIQGRILYRSGIPDVIRAGGAGGAGAAATGAAAGKGAIILKGLAILGGLIAFAVVSYYVAGAFGEWSADKPIKPTWLGDPEERAAYQAEKSTHAVIYGDMIAITHGYNEYIDVTDNSLGELRYLYPPTDSLDEELQEYYYSTDRYVLCTVPVLHICTGSLFSRADTGFDNTGFDNPGSRPRPNDPVTLANMPHIDIPTIGKYKTYGEVCNAIAKIENYPKEKEFSYCYKLDYFGGCHTVVFCKRERL